MSSALHTQLPRRLTFAAALVVCLGATTAAQGAVSASLSFSDARFTLTDLTPDDGIGPSATFNTAGTTVTTFANVGSGGNGDSSNLVGLPLPTLSISDGFGSAAIGGTNGVLSSGLSSSTQVVSDVSSSGVTAFGSSESTATVGYEPAFDTPGMDGYQFTITLAANTSISFDLSYATALSLSPQQLADIRDGALAQVDPTKTVAFNFYNADASAGLLSAFYAGALGTDPAAVFNDGGQSLHIDESALCEECDLSDLTAQKSGTLSLSYANTTGSALDVSFLLMARTTASQSVSILYFPEFPPVDPEVPAIPEPGTWALMGLGLVGLALATRRRRRVGV